MDLSAEVCLKIYTDMWRIRLFEEEADRQTNLGNVVGTLHMYWERKQLPRESGQLERRRLCTWDASESWSLIAKGAKTDQMMAELWGKGTGTCKGKGGLMHVLISRSIC
ncbi:MAG: hypothetical protein CM1200mP18_11060 [Gammaproteobacteria bacterium]|nr:MAG: hypothetical protein CM1200mP18_11060 [Gammaproteobacteria bacterium]